MSTFKDISEIKEEIEALEASKLCNTLFLEDLLKKDMLYTENPFIPSWNICQSLIFVFVLRYKG